VKFFPEFWKILCMNDYPELKGVFVMTGGNGGFGQRNGEGVRGILL
jgi:hypothetical protein